METHRIAKTDRKIKWFLSAQDAEGTLIEASQVQECKLSDAEQIARQMIAGNASLTGVKIFAAETTRRSVAIASEVSR
jgi:hypothetical protein